MAEKTGISWCDHTFNPWIGCTKVSAACDFCYAEALMDHRHHRVEWGGERSRTGAANWQQPIKWNRAAKAAGVRRKVFCASLADVFDNQVPEEWRADLWALIALCPDLDWLLLTKRPQNIRKMVPKTLCLGLAWPWRHVWLGTTAENQREADRRAPELLGTPGHTLRFLSCEPLLEGIDIARYLGPDVVGKPAISWVICGGESGAGARPMRPDWARSLRDQCQAAGVPFHFKQWGEFSPDATVSSLRVLSHVWPDGRHCAYADLGTPGYSVATGTYTMARVGKRAAGRMLDGIEHSEFPA